MDAQNVRYEQHNNMQDKKLYDCDCGCGLTFLQGEGLGFKIKLSLEDEDIIMMEDHIVDANWKYYIPVALIETWGDLMETIEKAVADNPNDRVWCHLEPYLQNPDRIPDDTRLDYIYI